MVAVNETVRCKWAHKYVRDSYVADGGGGGLCECDYKFINEARKKIESEVLLFHSLNYWPRSECCFEIRSIVKISFSVSLHKLWHFKSLKLTATKWAATNLISQLNLWYSGLTFSFLSDTNREFVGLLFERFVGLCLGEVRKVIGLLKNVEHNL